MGSFAVRSNVTVVYIFFINFEQRRCAFDEDNIMEISLKIKQIRDK